MSRMPNIADLCQSLPTNSLQFTRMSSISFENRKEIFKIQYENCGSVKTTLRKIADIVKISLLLGKALKEIHIFQLSSFHSNLAYLQPSHGEFCVRIWLAGS